MKPSNLASWFGLWSRQALPEMGRLLSPLAGQVALFQVKNYVVIGLKACQFEELQSILKVSERKFGVIPSGCKVKQMTKFLFQSRQDGRPRLPPWKRENRQTSNKIKGTHRLNLKISLSPWSSSSWCSYRSMSLFAPSCWAKVRAICPDAPFLRSSLLTSATALQSFHLTMKLSGKFLVLRGEFSDSILRYPIIPPAHSQTLRPSRIFEFGRHVSKNWMIVKGM
jgi:hypothetical protein